MELGRHIGVSYPTSWKIKHKIMQAMQERDNQYLLRGIVQLDDAYLPQAKALRARAVSSVVAVLAEDPRIRFHS
jgi:hypothetical protein